MNIYKVERIDPVDWDEFQGMVVSATSEDAARLLHPVLEWRLSDGEVLDCIKESLREFEEESRRSRTCWVFLKDVNTLRVTLVGTAHAPSTTVILTDYKSG